MTARSKENGREIFYDKVLNCWRYEDTHEIVQNLDKNEESKEAFANVVRPSIIKKGTIIKVILWNKIERFVTTPMDFKKHEDVANWLSSQEISKDWMTWNY